MPLDAMCHNFVVLKKADDPGGFVNVAVNANDNGYIPKDMTNEIVAHTKLVPGGQTKAVTFTMPKETGDYTYIYTSSGYYAAGMKRTMRVK